MQDWRTGVAVPPVDLDARDREHLKLLRTLHYVMAAVTAVYSLFPLIQVGLGLAMLSGRWPGFGGSAAGGGPPSVDYMAWMFVAMGVAFVVYGEIMAVLNFLVARFLERRERRKFCIVVSALNCLSVPHGTALGAFTIIVLQRPNVRGWFTAAAPEPSEP